MVGTAEVNSANDPLIGQVGYVKAGAFEDCDFVSRVDLTGANKLEAIPEACFKDCDVLMDVVLPESVNSIQYEAFANVKPCSVRIPGREVDIATNAFEHTSQVTIETYKDSLCGQICNLS